MEFLSDPYRVMVVTASESFDTETRALLPPSEFYPVTSVHAVGEARRRLVSEAFDIVVVSSPLPDETGLEFALDLCATPATAARNLADAVAAAAPGWCMKICAHARRPEGFCCCRGRSRSLPFCR